MVWTNSSLGEFEWRKNRVLIGITAVRKSDRARNFPQVTSLEN